MKKIFLLIILIILIISTSLTDCVYDSMFCMGIINHTNDTIYVCFAQYNDIDSVKYGIKWGDQLKFDNTGKIVTNKRKNENSIIFPDSCGMYCEPGSRNSFFFNSYEKKGYFFIVKLETINNYTWEEIRKNKLYDKLIVTREILKKKK